MAGAASANSPAGTTETNGSLPPSTVPKTVKSVRTGSERGRRKLICCGLAYVSFADTPLTVTLVPHKRSGRLEESSPAVQFARPLPNKEAYAPGARPGDKLAALSTAIAGLRNPVAIR